MTMAADRTQDTSQSPRVEVREFNSPKLIGIGTVEETYMHPVSRQLIACVRIPGLPGRWLRPLCDLRVART